MDKFEWFKEAKFGMMIHWGLYCLPAGEWKGQRMDYIGEWLQSRYRIPNAQYHPLASAFNPILFNADEWAQLAADAGMKYMVFTAKHHEGFAMYHSRVDKFNIVDATPYGRDVMYDLANACARHGINFGLYYSQDLDWSDPDGGGYTRPHDNCGMSWTNDWDFPDNANQNYTLCYERKIKPQVKEILTQYGDLCLIWFDVPMTINESQSRRIYEAVKKYQPNCLINSRLGNGAYDYVSLGDNEIPDKLEDTTGKAVDMNSIGGFKPSPYGLYETAATLNDTWGFSYHDHNWKTPEFIRSTREKLNGMGINYLINVGPDPLGRITADAQRILRGAAK